MVGYSDLTAVLINLPVAAIEDDKRQPPGGLVSIATFAAAHGYDVRVIDLAGLSQDDLADAIPVADVYGFSTYSAVYEQACQVVARVRRRCPDSVYVAGGPHASALPEDVSKSFDTVVCGEGEEAFVSILRLLAHGRKRHLPQIIRASPIRNLDELPFPDFRRFCDMRGYTRQINGAPAISLDSSRGCDHHCRFCNSRVMQRGQWRARSAENVAAEVLRHRAQGWTAFRFNDDNFLVDSERALKICGLLRPLKIRFRIFARAEALQNRELCEQLLAAGCVHVSVGIESLSPQMLARMGKSTHVQQVLEGLATARSVGLSTRGFFIVGFPGETEATVAETVGALGRLPLDEGTAYPCIPYPGTDLFSRPEYYGITWMDPDFSHYIQVGTGKSAGFVMRTTTFGPDEVRHWRELLLQAFENHGIAWSDERRLIV